MCLPTAGWLSNEVPAAGVPPWCGSKEGVTTTFESGVPATVSNNDRRTNDD